MQRNKVLYIFIAVLTLVAVVYSIYINLPTAGSGQNENSTSTESAVCTMDAKLCPDGSYVGRVAPNCEFAACPGSNNQSDLISTTTNQGVTFSYPKKLNAAYVDLLLNDEFNPTVVLLKKPFACVEKTSTESGQVELIKKVVNGIVYCVSREDEGAAGSTYRSYEYSFAEGESTVVLSFNIRYPGCYNYDDPVKTECENSQRSFDVDMFADQIVKTIKFNN